MLTAIPVTIPLSAPVLGRVARMDSAVSDAGREVIRYADALRQYLESSSGLFGARLEAISRIRELVNECAVRDWDGYGAEPVSPSAAGIAIEFIRALPPGLPLPEFAPEPDGAISLDWIRSPNRLLSVSAGATSRLAYAWLDGVDRGYATATFDGASVPPRVVDAIRGIMDDGGASIRTA